MQATEDERGSSWILLSLGLVCAVVGTLGFARWIDVRITRLEDDARR